MRRLQQDHPELLRELFEIEVKRRLNETLKGVQEKQVAQEKAAAERALRAANHDSLIELKTILGQDLDLEQALRAYLEWLLQKIGPANMSIFLPSTTGDWTVGEYVNYDHPKDTAELMLEHLAGFTDQFQDGVLFDAPRGAEDWHDWLDGHAVYCRRAVSQEEELACIMVFRDKKTGFLKEHLALIDESAPIFAAQVARIIQVHHRHIPKEMWGREPS